jgi:predicted PurR-regulated permease PerM
MAGPVSEWIGRAPEIGATIKQSFPCSTSRLPRCASWRKRCSAATARSTSTTPPNVVLPVVAFLTPAAGELLLFFGTLMFFLVGQIELRIRIVSMFANRDAKLRFLKIMRDIEKNLAGYLTGGDHDQCRARSHRRGRRWLIGFPNPAIFGLLAALLNYVPYVGPAVMVIVCLASVSSHFPSLGHAFIAPIGFVALTTMEGHFVTPTIVGRRLTLNPLLVFLALAFWTWMWGPARRVPCRAAVDHRPRDFQPFVSLRRR